MKPCSQPTGELCAKHDGHPGECRCTWFELYDQARQALETLVGAIRHTESMEVLGGGTGHTEAREYLKRQAATASEVLLREPLTEAERQRREEDFLLEREDRRRQHELDQEVDDPEAARRGVDARKPVRALLANLKAALPELEKLLAECSSHWGYEDPIYRLYHQSFKVYWLQQKTSRIVAAVAAQAG